MELWQESDYLYRDGQKKEYVRHRLEAAAADVYLRLTRRGAYIYLLLPENLAADLGA